MTISNGIKKSVKYGWMVCGLAALFYCYEYLLRIQPSVMSTDLMRYYALNAAAFGNLFAIYYYIYTPMQLPVGILLDKYGPRVLLTMASFVCALGAFLFACSDNLLFAQMGRLLMGFGSAFAFVGVLKVASLWLPSNRFAMIAGLATTLGMIGGMVGDNLMALMVRDFGWRETTYISAAVGVILAFVLWYTLKKPGDNATQKETKTEELQPRFKTLIVSVLLSLKNPQIWLIALIGGVLYTSLSVFAELWGVPYLEQAKHFSSQEAVSAVSMVFLGWAVGGPIVGFISDRFSNQRSPLFWGGLIGAACIASVIYIPNLPLSFTSILLFLFGVFASAQVIIFAIAKDNNPEHLAASAVALANTFVMLMGCILQPLVGKILDLGWDGTMIDGVHHYNNSNFQMALLVIPVLFIISAICSLFLKKNYSSVAQD
jgi:sugar phosphate permease